MIPRNIREWEITSFNIKSYFWFQAIFGSRGLRIKLFTFYLYFLMQPGLDKNIFFVMEFGQNPPVTTAIYLWKFENSSSQLNLLSECLQSITELDEKRISVLYKRKKWINFLCLFTHFRPLDQWDTFFWYFLTLPYSPKWKCAIHQLG